jgi:hypothetical protein
MSLAGIIPRIETRSIGLLLEKLKASKPLRYAAQLGLVGFAVSTALFICMMISSWGRFAVSPRFFLVLCPPSLDAMPLGHSGWHLEPLHWLLISVENAALYSLVGLIFGASKQP